MFLLQFTDLMEIHKRFFRFKANRWRQKYNSTSHVHFFVSKKELKFDKK